MVEPNPVLSFWRKWKILIIIVGCVVLLIGIWGLFTWGSNWWSMRQIDKIKANVNAASKEIEGIQANIQKEKQAEAAALERVKIETNSYLNSVNATNAAREETNRAIQNMQSAVNGNRPVNVTAEELERRLKELGY